MSAKGHLFCFGCGYSAGVLTRLVEAEGWRTGGTSRDVTRREVTQGDRLEPFDRARPLANAAGSLRDVTHLLISVPPDSSGDLVLALHGPVIAAAPRLQWIGYLSTTGVYGDTGGAIVDETASLNPSNARGRYRVDAEAAWLAFGQTHGVAVQVFRLAGIYGPGRSALDKARTGNARRIDLPGHAFSRIHVDDIAAVLRASMAAPDAGRVYNVCDDEAAPGGDVVSFACDLLGVAPPPLVALADADLSAMARSFYDDSRRISNTRIKRELGVNLRYPTYREGLTAILAAEA